MTRATEIAARAAKTAADPRWQRVLARDAAADGAFYYSVKTSGVYCRPSCKSRPARPENIAFHATPQAAEVAGFRACKRCRPDQQIETIRYTIGTTQMGLMLVAVSDAGICALLLGDDAVDLTADFVGRFPRAKRVADAKGLADTLHHAARLAADPSAGSDMKLDPRGTDFQRRVWQALRSIPAGQTLSYRDLAAKIGAPAAVRAVASACGANPVAIAIPCHRILRGDGAISGYRWGVARKERLLALEGRV